MVNSPEPGQQHKSQRHLRDDQRRTRPQGSALGGAGAAVLAEHFVEVAADQMENRHQSEREPGRECDGAADCEHRRVDTNHHPGGQVLRRKRRESAGGLPR